MAPTAARLSSLSTSTLSSILELTRLSQLSPDSAPPPSLLQGVTRALAQLDDGLAQVARERSEPAHILAELRAQRDRLWTLVDDLDFGIARPPSPAAEQDEDEGVDPLSRRGELGVRQTRTGQLVDTDSSASLADASYPSGVSVSSDETLRSGSTRARGQGSRANEDVRIDLGIEGRGATEARSEQDEDDLRRSNQEVMQMQRQMMDDQDTQLNSLASAIQRQHELSMHISTELAEHEELLDETDAAVDRTSGALRRARGRLDDFSKRAKDTGSTGLIVALVVVLLILVIIFKL